MRPWPEVWGAVYHVPSATSEAECEALWRLAQASTDAVVEIGCWRGRTAAVLADGAQRLITTIDPLTPYRDGDETVRPPDADAVRHEIRGTGRGDLVRLVHASSPAVAASWADGPIGLLFIDGDHREEAVRADWEAWSAHLAPGAVVAWHDYLVVEGWETTRWAGVRRVVDALVEAGTLAILDRVDRLVWTTAAKPSKRRRRATG